MNTYHFHLRTFISIKINIAIGVHIAFIISNFLKIRDDSPWKIYSNLKTIITFDVQIDR